MDFVNNFSVDFQIKLFHFTYAELLTFFDIHFWLKEERDEKIIEETLRRFYPNHFKNLSIMKISENGESSVSFDQNKHEKKVVENEEEMKNMDNNEQKVQKDDKDKETQIKMNEWRDDMLKCLNNLADKFQNECASIVSDLCENIRNLKEEECFKMDISLYSNQQQTALKSVLESIGIFYIENFSYCLFSNPTQVSFWIALSQEFMRDHSKKIAQSADSNKDLAEHLRQNIPQKEINRDTNDRALLAKLAMERRQQGGRKEWGGDGELTKRKTESVKSQIEQYRSQMRQKQLNEKRFTSQNIMTFEKLAQQQEENFKNINEGVNLPDNPKRTMNLQDIQEMRNRENIIAYGKNCILNGRKQALQYTNDFRKENNLSPLTWNEELTYIGKKHSQDMGEGKVPFGHQGFNQRANQIGFSKYAVYENVAYCTEGYFNIPKTIVDGWINSPGHRKNLLSNSNCCGIGVYKQVKYTEFNQNRILFLFQIRSYDGKWYFTQLLALKG